MKSSNNSEVFLQADDCFLRPWRVEDAEWYVKSRDEVVFEWTTEKRDLTVEETEDAIRKVNNNPDAFSFAIVDSSSKAILGNIALVLEENDRSVGEIMYWLAPWGRGRGLATNAVKLLCRWAFDSLALERVTLKTHPQNVHSQKVAERAGFCRRVGTNEGNPDAQYLWFELVAY